MYAYLQFLCNNFYKILREKKMSKFKMATDTSCALVIIFFESLQV